MRGEGHTAPHFYQMGTAMSEEKGELDQDTINHYKLSWLKPAMNGSDEDLIQCLLGILPGTRYLDAQGWEQLNSAKPYLVELWSRGVSREQVIDACLKGVSGDILPAGISRRDTFDSPAPRYFKLFLSGKNAQTCADGLKKLLYGRRNSVGEYARSYRVLFYIDVDTDSPSSLGLYQLGLTPDAVCFDVNLADIESCSDAIDKAATIIAAKSIYRIRLGVGQFGPAHYGLVRGNYLLGKRIPFEMTSDWLLLKNIMLRAGRFGWFWRLVARWYEGSV